MNEENHRHDLEVGSAGELVYNSTTQADDPLGHLNGTERSSRGKLLVPNSQLSKYLTAIHFKITNFRQFKLFPEFSPPNIGKDGALQRSIQEV